MKGCLLVLALLCSLCAWPARADGVPPGHLRLATYNAYLLSPMFKCPPLIDGVPNPLLPDCLRQIEGETERWAQRLADTIIARYHELDVVAINEAWDEDAKRILADRLRDRYPVQVRKLDAPLLTIRAEAFTDGVNAEGEVVVKGEDSGLMLFAKDDFDVVELPVQDFRWRNQGGNVLDASSRQVAFVLFEACGDDDCKAAKGAALVRLRHRQGGQIHNIVFTHMQADYPAEGLFFADERLKQFKAIRKLIEVTLPGLSSRLADARETLFLLGDLNVPFLKTHTEWDARFRSGYFADSMYESMVFSSSTRDLTPTNEYDDERLDYIVSSPRPFVQVGKHTCTQHVTVPPAFRALESDHWMVHADVARGFYHCSPATAYRLTLPASGALQDFDQAPDNPALDVTHIKTPGAMQWVYVDASQGGTFSIGTDHASVRADVYLPEDLTHPISRYNQTKATVPHCVRQCYALDQYVLPRRFYIRLSGATRNTTADYALGVRRHTCASRQDACLLEIGADSGARLSAQDILPGTPSQDEAWFRFHVTGTATSGTAQIIALAVRDVDGQRVDSELVDLELAPGSGQPQRAQSGSTQTHTLQAAHGSKGYLRVRQNAPRPGSVGTRITARYDSNLRYLTVGNLICNDETNPESGSDDIYTRFRIDGANRRAPAQGYVEFDCDEHNDPEVWWTRVGDKELRYLHDLSIRIVEDDDTSDNDESNRFSVPPLGQNQLVEPNGRVEWTFDGGKYRFEYVLRRRRDGPVGD
jgi:hypothetical protein